MDFPIIQVLRLATSTTAQPMVITTGSVIPDTMFRATTVEQMYDIVTDTQSYDYVYQIGRPPLGNQNIIKIRNKCVENPLGFALSFPNWLTITPFGITLGNTGTTTIQSYLVPIGYTLELTIALNENNTRILSTQGPHDFSSMVQFKVTPLNVTGPVLVQKVVPPLTL